MIPAKYVVAVVTMVSIVTDSVSAGQYISLETNSSVQSIPHLEIDNDVTRIELRHKSITSLGGGEFENYAMLTELVIGFSELQTIADNDTFKGSIIK